MTKLCKGISAFFDYLTPVMDLLARFWIAKIFFISGLTKIQSWDTTVALFESEYKVPLLSPYMAAFLGTGAELVLPVLLALGLGGRVSIMVFFIYNILCVLFYPHLWTPGGRAGLDEHICWGLLLGLLMTHGPGKLSIDYWLCKKYGAKCHSAK